MSKKYYAVRKGRKPGIYTTWADAQKQVHGFKSASFKSFTSKADAEAFIQQNNGPSAPVEKTDADTVIAYVDGSYHKKTNRYSFGAVILQNGEILEKLSRVGDNPRYQGSWQIAGEVFGALHAIHWAIKEGYKTIIIHYDYVGIEKWALGEWKAHKPVSQDYIASFKKLATKINVQFVKVKAHSGIEYNEMVDQLAKDAFKDAPSDE